MPPAADLPNTLRTYRAVYPDGGMVERHDGFWVVSTPAEDRLFKRPFSSQNTPRRALGHAPTWLLGAAPAG